MSLQMAEICFHIQFIEQILAAAAEGRVREAYLMCLRVRVLCCHKGQAKL